jgi:hypothetical protein
VVGNVTFVLGVVAAVLAWVVPAGRSTRVTATVMTVLLLAQTGLGYGGRTSLTAATWHVPLGVAIFGLAVHHLHLVGRR